MKRKKNLLGVILGVLVAGSVALLALKGFSGNDTQYYIPGAKEALKGNMEIGTNYDGLLYVLASVIIICAIVVAWITYTNKIRRRY